MSPAVLKIAMAFGGSMNYGNRQGIGRFGMGMKTAALSIARFWKSIRGKNPAPFTT
jgi:hypothetical protein